MNNHYDIIVIGSGPNGLSAGIFLAQKGLKVLILEASHKVGGGTRTDELTLPNFHHDICSAVHPMGVLSPYFKELGLEKYGLEWVYPKASVAHPLDGEDAVILSKSLEDTAENLGIDKKRYEHLMRPFVKHPDWLIEDSLKPIGIPKHLLYMTNFGSKAALPANTFAKLFFKGKRAKALFAGCAAHSILPFDFLFTSALGLVFLTIGHDVNWPVAKGGSQSIANALLQCFQEAGGEIQFSQKVTNFQELPPAKAYIFDTDAHQMAEIAQSEFPNSYYKRLKKFYIGPGVFKIDYALNEPIPWKDRRVLEASTVHVGGTIEELAAGEKAAWQGKITEKPYVLMAQQSQFDNTRAPKGKHTCWAYCHVPFGNNQDLSEIIENQIERFAPGFRDVVLTKSSMNADAFQAYNPNYVGGAITGGAVHLPQLFTRPVVRLNPYSTAIPNV